MVTLAGAAQASDPAQTGLAPDATWLQRADYHVSQNPNLSRYVANECVISSVAAMVVALVPTGPLAPAVSAALGVEAGMSVLSIGGLACAAGAAAGLVAAGMITALGESDTIQEAAAEQMAWIWNNIPAVPEFSVAALWDRASQLTSDAVQTVASVVPESWSVASLWNRANQLTNDAVQMVAAAPLIGWHLREIPPTNGSDESEFEIAIIVMSR